MVCYLHTYVTLKDRLLYRAIDWQSAPARGRQNCCHFGLELAFLRAVAFVPTVKLLLEKNGLKYSQRNKSSLNSIHTTSNHSLLQYSAGFLIFFLSVSPKQSNEIQQQFFPPSSPHFPLVFVPKMRHRFSLFFCLGIPLSQCHCC